MAIQSNFPAIRPTLDLNFAGSRTVDPRITFTRASTATYFDEFGVMRTVPANSPRIDFDPVTGECKGLLIEEQRTNLLMYSEQFDNSTWGKSNVTVIANAVVAPDGTLAGEKLVENTANPQHQVTQGLTLKANTVYTLSVYAKAAERPRLNLTTSNIANWSVNVATTFDLVVGTVVNGVGTITPVGGGWYRCSVVGTFGAANATGGMNIFPVQAGSTSQIYTGDGTSGIYIWGAQLEVGAFPTSYIKTEASQVTRAADSAVMTGGNFSSWNNTTGTLLAKYSNSGWRHNNTPPSTQLDLAKYIQDYSTSIVSDSIKRVMFYPRQLTDAQIAALKG